MDTNLDASVCGGCGSEISWGTDRQDGRWEMRGPPVSMSLGREGGVGGGGAGWVVTTWVILTIRGLVSIPSCYLHLGFIWHQDAIMLLSHSTFGRDSMFPHEPLCIWAWFYVSPWAHLHLGVILCVTMSPSAFGRDSMCHHEPLCIWAWFYVSPWAPLHLAVILCFTMSHSAYVWFHMFYHGRYTVPRLNIWMKMSDTVPSLGQFQVFYHGGGA